MQNELKCTIKNVASIYTIRHPFLSGHSPAVPQTSSCHGRTPSRTHSRTTSYKIKQLNTTRMRMEKANAFPSFYALQKSKKHLHYSQGNPLNPPCLCSARGEPQPGWAQAAGSALIPRGASAPGTGQTQRSWKDAAGSLERQNETKAKKKHPCNYFQIISKYSPFHNLPS